MRVGTFIAGMAAGAALVAAVAATTLRSGATAEPTSTRAQAAPHNDNERAAQNQAGQARGDAAGRGAWRGGEGQRREMSEEEIDRVIATAREVNPEWADGLEKLRQSDPKALRDRLSREARKLMGLSMMKEREPQLYKVRVEDLRVQNQIRELSEAWNTAKQSGDLAAQETAMKEIEAGARKQVELDIQARGFELVALDRSLKDARKRLQDDIRDREKSVAEIVDSIRNGEEIKFGRRPMGMGGRPRGEEIEPARKPQAPARGVN
ncbi:MAG: hypothetical protein K8R92_05940 [Planctomycetes bacterium]|nr:hypothetical protein [Planctomycetota bacterium]